MFFGDTYKTIKIATESQLREKASKFFGFAYPIKNEQEAKEIIQSLKKKYPDASHHCYAYILGLNKDIFRANDDGEPANTAGKPIHRAIQSLGVTDVLVVVVRYFGGTLLGVPGLINAYGNSAKQTLEMAEIVDKTVEETYEVNCTYEQENEVFKILKQHEAVMVGIEKTSEVKITFTVRKSAANDIYEKVIKNTNAKIAFIK
jgi:uncharacterized YigZ family protein